MRRAHSSRRAALLVAPLAALVASVARAADDAPEAPNFVDHVQPILRDSCLACHRGSRAKNGLDLSSVQKILAGGSSGAAVVPGDPDGSLLLQVVEHARQPFMPPDDDQLEATQRATLRAWIQGGARVDAEDPGAAAAATAEAPTLPAARSGAAPMPDGLATQPAWWTDRPGPVTALATSPGAPLAAVGGLGQVSLYALLSADGSGGPALGALLGVLPFPEGRPERVRFDASGHVLLAAGGRAGERGLAVGWDVATGARLFALGDEPDTVLDADVASDLGTVVLGGPDRVVRAYDPRTGELRWEAKAHTDWVTAVAISPDGLLAASGDRAGGAYVFEALTGREFHRLDPARGAISAIAWRADGGRFAVVDEAGGVRVFDAEEGRQRGSWNAHGGALGVAWLPDGALVTVGRDGAARVTDAGGRQRVLLAGAAGASLAVAAAADGAHVLVGDGAGRARVLALAGGAEVAALPAYPVPDERRALDEARAAAERQRAALPAAREASAAAEVLSAAAAAAASLEGPLAEAESTLRAAEVELRVARARAEASAAERARYAPGLAARAAILNEATRVADAASLASAGARAALEAAVDELLAAEEALAKAENDTQREARARGRELAARLADGDAAAAQLAAARAAEADVARARATWDEAGWRARAAPATARAEADAAQVVGLSAAAAEGVAARNQALAAQEAARTTAREHAEALAAARAAEAALVTRLAEVEGRLPSLEVAWSARAAALETSRGRVHGP